MEGDTEWVEIEEIPLRPPGRPSLRPLLRYKSFRHQAAGWSKPRRIVAKVERHAGELFPRVGVIVANMSLPSRSEVRFDAILPSSIHCSAVSGARRPESRPTEEKRSQP